MSAASKKIEFYPPLWEAFRKYASAEDVRVATAFLDEAPKGVREAFAIAGRPLPARELFMKLSAKYPHYRAIQEYHALAGNWGVAARCCCHRFPSGRILLSYPDATTEEGMSQWLGMRVPEWLEMTRKPDRGTLEWACRFSSHENLRRRILESKAPIRKQSKEVADGLDHFLWEPLFAFASLGREHETDVLLSRLEEIAQGPGQQYLDDGLMPSYLFREQTRCVRLYMQAKAANSSDEAKRLACAAAARNLEAVRFNWGKRSRDKDLFQVDRPIHAIAILIEFEIEPEWGRETLRALLPPLALARCMGAIRYALERGIYCRPVEELDVLSPEEIKLIMNPPRKK